MTSRGIAARPRPPTARRRWTRRPGWRCATDPEACGPGSRSDGLALLIGDELTLVVHPDARGAGVGRTLLEEALRSIDGPLSAWSHGDHPAAAALAASHGFERVRELWVMRRSSSVELLPIPTCPTTVTVRAYTPADAEDVVRVNAAAFAHHPEQGAMDADEPGRADGGAVVRPGRAAPRRRAATGCSASTGPSSTPPSSVRCTSSASTRPPRAGASASCSRSLGCTTSPAWGSPRSCCTSSPTTRLRSRSTQVSASATQPVDTHVMYRR